MNAADADVVRQIEIERANDVRTGMVTADQAEAILSHLDRFHYASRRHVTFLLLWTVGCRLGAIRASDVDDVGRQFEDVSGPALRLRHRPETDTPLENGEGGERFVAITDEILSIVEDFVNASRPAVTDKHDREPLLATKQGRAALATLRNTLYIVTRTRWYGEPCPAGRIRSRVVPLGRSVMPARAPRTTAPATCDEGGSRSTAGRGSNRRL